MLKDDAKFKQGLGQVVLAHLRKLLGDDPLCELEYKNDIDLLVSIILSAQCTDKRVNAVTKTLFRKYRTVSDYSNAEIKELEAEIHSCGFYHAKAANIVKTAKAVLEKFNGVVPDSLEDLVTLPGVGRKTANVFLAEFYQTPCIAVDTHVTRVSHRLGLSAGKTPDEIESELEKIFDRRDWIKMHKYLVLFGRYHCKAKKPDCMVGGGENCGLSKVCNYFKNCAKV